MREDKMSDWHLKQQYYVDDKYEFFMYISGDHIGGCQLAASPPMLLCIHTKYTEM